MLVIDTETTGLIENMSTRFDHQPEVIEFCGIIINDKGNIIDVFDQLIKPTAPITAEITGMNNITNEMVAKSPSFAEVAAPIRDLIEAANFVIAHNAAFDRDMLDLEFARQQLTKIAWPRLICTVEATLHFKGYRLTLSDLYEYLFKEKFAGAHRAKVDTEALVRIVKELKKRGEL